MVCALVGLATLELLDGSDCFRVVAEVALLNDHSCPGVEQLEHRLAYGDPAARPVSTLLSRNQKHITEVDHLVRLEPEVIEGPEPTPPHPKVSIAANEDRLLIRSDQV